MCSRWIERNRRTGWFWIALLLMGCTPEPQAPALPTITISGVELVAVSATSPALITDARQRALAHASQTEATLVGITAFGMAPEGTVDLTTADGFIQLQFRTPKGDLVVEYMCDPAGPDPFIETREYVIGTLLEGAPLAIEELLPAQEVARLAREAGLDLSDSAIFYAVHQGRPLVLVQSSAETICFDAFDGTRVELDKP